MLEGEVVGWRRVTDGAPPGWVQGLTSLSTLVSGTKMRSTLIKFEALIQKWIGIIQKNSPREFLRGHKKKDEGLVENTRL